MAISKATVGSDIWEAFYNALNGNISVTLSDSSTSTVQTYTGAFPDKDIDVTSKYPILVIENPSLNWTDFTLTKKYVEGNILIEIYSSGAEAAQKLTNDVIETLETNRYNFTALKLLFVNLESQNYDSFMRGEMKIHKQGTTFSFKYPFTTTKVY